MDVYPSSGNEDAESMKAESCLYLFKLFKVCF